MAGTYGSGTYGSGTYGGPGGIGGATPASRSAVKNHRGEHLTLTGDGPFTLSPLDAAVARLLWPEITVNST